MTEHRWWFVPPRVDARALCAMLEASPLRLVNRRTHLFWSAVGVLGEGWSHRDSQYRRHDLFADQFERAIRYAASDAMDGVPVLFNLEAHQHGVGIERIVELRGKQHWMYSVAKTRRIVGPVPPMPEWLQKLNRDLVMSGGLGRITDIPIIMSNSRSG